MKLRIKETIIVEGKYDKNTLSQIVDANIVTLSGFSIFNDIEKALLIKSLAEKNGIIIFTDCDGAGFVLRNYIKGIVPAEYIKNAYTPEIFGKERRKKAPSKEGKLGVEGIDADTLIQSLKRSGATFEDCPEQSKKDVITKTDMFRLGLSGGDRSADKREKILKKLGFPSLMSCNSMIEAMNILFSKEEFFEIAGSILD